MKYALSLIFAFVIGFALAFGAQIKVEAGLVSFKAALITAVTNNFTAGDRQKIADAFADMYGYQATVNGSPNPQTKADFAADRVVDYIKSVVNSRETGAAVRAIPTPTPLAQ
jgi:hypothetical protein